MKIGERLSIMSLTLLSMLSRRQSVAFPCVAFLRGHQRIQIGGSRMSSVLSIHGNAFCEALNDDENESNGSEEGEDSIALHTLHEQIAKLNSGVPINIQSPKQVSSAIFGRPQSVNKSVLQQAVEDDELAPDKRHIAKLILQWKELFYASNKRSAASTTSLKGGSTPYEGDVGALLPSASRVMSQTTNQPTYEQMVDSMFDRPRSQLDPYWRNPMRNVTRPVARELVKQMNAELCPMGFDPNATPKGSLKTANPSAGKKGTFLAFCREQKRLYPQCILLTRMGDFYETFGLDAVLLVEHAGLNPMGGKVKAGCPWRNVQSTLNCLTEQGFSVAVYEEMGQTASSKLKTRVLSQIVSPASPTYLYDNWLLGGDQEHSSLDQLPASRPCVGIVRTAAGYHLAEVSLEERSVEYSERLTPEAVACRLAAYPPADPLVYIPSPTELSPTTRSLSFLPHYSRPITEQEGERVETNLGGFRIRTVILPPSLIPTSSKQSGSEADRYIQAVVDTLIQWNAKRRTDDDDDVASDSMEVTTYKDFTISRSSSHTNPLYLETARQLGLLKDPGIPSLLSHILDDAAPAATRRFLQRYLLVPPPPEVAKAMSIVVRTLMDPETSIALPSLLVPPLGKVLSLIRAGQASANIYGEFLQTLAVTQFVLEQPNWEAPKEALLTMCSHESGLVAERESLQTRCKQATNAIEAVISEIHHAEDSGRAVENNETVSHCPYIPDNFFERNELPWRGRVQRAVAEGAYLRVEKAAQALCDAVAADYIFGDDANKGLIKQDIFNNMFALQKVPNGAKAEDYSHPRDRHGKRLSNRFSTKRVDAAMSEYVAACDNACNEVSSVLSNLAKSLQDEGHIPALIQSAHFNLALSAAFHHAVKAGKQNWQQAEIIEPNSSTPARFVDVWPYWMPKSQAVPNSFDLNGLFLLTAPNMSGKSTLMRATAAAALLTVCGLCAPLEAGSKIPRFDTLFLRGASADVPAENKSAFGAEMEDIAALMRCCGPHSLVFVDEIGRGTSPHDGTRLAGAIFEAMVNEGMRGVFATHLHDILQLPLQIKEPVIAKQMGIYKKAENNTTDSPFEWTYRLNDGVCNDSLAMVTASRFGLPQGIIERADELERFLPTGDFIARSASESNEVYTTTNVDAKWDKDRKKDFLEAVNLAESLLGKTSIAIPPRCHPPPTLARQSCVYIFELCGSPTRIYVGETDDLFQRLENHRGKGPAWSDGRVAVVPVPSKSDSRRWESQLIQHLAQSGFYMESTSDGRANRL